MALSGTIYGTVGAAAGINPGRRPWVWWQVISRDVARNRSLVRFTVGSDPLSGGTSGTFSGTLTINGYNYSVSGPVSANISNNIMVIPDDYWTHSADGSLTLNISLSGSVPGTSGWRSTSLAGTATLDKIISPPASPGGLSIVRNATRGATLSWTFGSGGSARTGVEPWRRENGGAWKKLAVLGPNVTS